MVDVRNTGRPAGTAVVAHRVIGRDTGPVARAFRVVAGGTGVMPVIVQLTDSSVGEVAVGLGWLLAIAALFTGVLALLRPWLEGRTSGGLTGFAGSALLLLPLMTYPLGLVPEGPSVGLRLYTDLSVLLSGVIGYGGLEMAALPTLLLGYRPVLYSQYNFVDLVEQPPAGLVRFRPAALAASALAIVGFVWFWIVPNVVVADGPFESAKPGVAALDPAAAGLIVLAGILLALRALAGDRSGRLLSGLLVVFGAGALVGAMPDALYAVIILGGLITAIARLTTRTRQTRPQSPERDRESDPVLH
jgi:hypothetical protein